MDEQREPGDTASSQLRRFVRLQRLELRVSTMLLLCVPLTAAVSYALYRLGRPEAFFAAAFALAPLIVLIALVFASGEFLMSCWRRRPQVQLLAEALLCVALTLAGRTA